MLLSQSCDKLKVMTGSYFCFICAYLRTFYPSQDNKQQSIHTLPAHRWGVCVCGGVATDCVCVLFFILYFFFFCLIRLKENSEDLTAIP